VFDEDIPGIYFNGNGVCNYCLNYDRNVRRKLLSGEESKRRLANILAEIKNKGRGKKYDCVIGLSGGVDSSYVAYLVKRRFGLKPLAIHLDNGWNSELAERNIKRLVNGLWLELHKESPDWEEFRDLQIAFLKSGVVDVEMPTDHAIQAFRMNICKQMKIKYYIGGSNVVTEAVMPQGWSYAKWDYRNIKAIHRKFGDRNVLESFPHYNYLQKIVSNLNIGNRKINILNYIDYNKEQAILTLKKELGWEPYRAKHYESVFTRFYQTYILPGKFGIDKRKAHLSNLICSGQITREQAIEELKMPVDTPEQLKRDKEIVLSKLRLSEDEFDIIMASQPKSHLQYPNNQFLNNIFKKIRKFLPM
jgi:N-acetyl sugar amidotransferase